MKPMRAQTTVTILLGLAACLPNAWAVTLFQTYDGTTAGMDLLAVSRRFITPPGVWTGDRKAISFTTDAGSYLLESATLNLSMPVGNSSDFVLSLYGDIGGHPASNGLLFTFSNPISFLVNPSPGNYTFGAVGMSLAPSTTYWIVAEPTLSSFSYFNWTAGTSGAGYDTAPIKQSSGAAWENWQSETGSSPSIVLTATVVPEPSVVALAFVGICRWFGIKRHYSASAERIQ